MSVTEGAPTCSAGLEENLFLDLECHTSVGKNVNHIKLYPFSGGIPCLPFLHMYNNLHWHNGFSFKHSFKLLVQLFC